MLRLKRNKIERVTPGCLDNLYKNRRIPYNWPNHIRVDTGERTYGSDYYQNMIVWSIPAAMDGHTIAQAAAPGQLFDRIMRAGRVPQRHLSDRPKVPGDVPSTVSDYVPPTVPEVEKR